MMTSYSVVSGTWEHAEALAPVMREADTQEVWATSHSTPLEALERSLVVSRDTRAGLVDGRVVCMFGVGAGTALSLSGYPWLLASDELVRHAVRFLRESLSYVTWAMTVWTRLENFVDTRNSAALRWLRWLGFSLRHAAPFGIDRRPFHYFYMERQHV